MLLSNLDLLATAPGGVARLRELILTLAVQGKLLPQDPNERPVDLNLVPELISRLINEGKVPSSRAVAEVLELDEDHDQLPMNWRVIGANKVLIPRSGNSKLIKGKLFDSNGEGLYAGYSASGQDVWLQTYEYEGTAIILSAVGARCGKAFLANEKWSAIANTHIVWPLEEVVLPAYGMLLLNDEKFWIRSGGAQPFVKVTETLEKSLWVPPLAEQSRIVTRVEEFMRLCDALEAKGQLEATQHAQLVSTLLGTLTASTTPEELADNWQRVAQHFDLLAGRPEAIDALEQTLLQLAVRGLLVPQDPTDEPVSVLLQKIRAEKDRLIAEGKIKRDKPLLPITDEEKPFELPVGWEWVRLRDLVTHLGDGLHGTPNYSLTGDYYFVNGNNLGSGVITIKPETKRVDRTEFEKHRKPLDATTVLLSINGTLGRVAFYRNEMIVLGKSACYFNVTVGLQKIFAKLLLECPDFMTYAEKSATGTTIKNLGLKAIGDWPIALPPLAEQSRIVTRVTAVRGLCTDLRQRLAERQSVQARLAEALVASVA